MEQNIEIFKNYVYKYNINDPMIKLKYDHSIRVMNLCNDFANKLNFDKEDIVIMTIIGLLHDYSRFEQWTNYKSFDDFKSIDHADLAIKRLFDDNDIKQFIIKKQYYNYIKSAIKYHNKFNIPSNLSEVELEFCKIIRDTDKIDILENNGIGLNKKIISNKYIVSKKVEKDFLDYKELNRKDIKTNGDNILLYLAMIFDLNYKESLEYIYNNKIIDKIFNNINRNKNMKKYFDSLKEYIEKRI